MANKMTKTDNRGSFMKSQFSGGGYAPSMEMLTELFNPEKQERRLTRQELSNRIIEYFKSCIDEVLDVETGQIEKVWKKAPTKSGLCLVLGIDIKTLSNYLKDERSDGLPFNNAADEHCKRVVSRNDFDLLHIAVNVIENFYEGKLSENRNCAGIIFWLNNLRNPAWSNTQSFNFDVRSINDRENGELLEPLPDLSKLYSHDEGEIEEEGY